MSGSLLGRGRAGRLAVYAGCGVVVFLLVFLYNTSTSEMARLKDLHTQCAHQQEALAAQLQVIFEYKVRLEKSLAEEKSSNAAVKQELQQRASREKSLRDKDSVEAMQRFNSLQQTYKLLQTEHKDLQEECKKRQKQALDDTTKLEETLKELRGHLRQAREEKEKSLEHLKTKYLELEVEKSRLEEKYNDLLKSNGNTNSTIDHLKKEVFQLKRELADTKKSCKSPSIDSILASIPTSQKSTSQQQQQPQQDPSVEKWGAGAGAKQAPSQQQQQQVSRPNNDDENPQPLHAPRDHHAIGDALPHDQSNIDENEDRGDENRNGDDDDDDPLQMQNGRMSNVGFAQKDGNIVPIGLNDLKDTKDPKDVKEQKNFLPIPYAVQDKHSHLIFQNDLVELARPAPDVENEPKQMLSPPNNNNYSPKINNEDKKASSKKMEAPNLKPPNNS